MISAITSCLWKGISKHICPLIKQCFRLPLGANCMVYLSRRYPAPLSINHYSKMFLSQQLFYRIPKANFCAILKSEGKGNKNL